MSEELQLNLDTAWDFVSNMSRGRPMHLVAIGEAGGVVAATFEPNSGLRMFFKTSTNIRP